jgi:hypothetical protein
VTWKRTVDTYTQTFGANYDPAIGFDGDGSGYYSGLDYFTPGFDAAARGIEAGDYLEVTTDSGTTSHEVVSLPDALTLQITPPFLPVAPPYSYVINSRGVAQHAAASAAIGAPELDLGAVEAAVRSLTQGARYTSAVSTPISTYASDLGVVMAELDAYVIARETTIDKTVRLLEEYGFDRALELFLRLELKDFFSLDADGVSYKTWVIRKSADVAREVVPVAKGTTAIRGWQVASSTSTPFDPKGGINSRE